MQIKLDKHANQAINTTSSFTYMSNPVLDSCCLHRSASTAAPQLCPLQLLLPDCVCFNCCSLIASVSTALRLRPLQLLLHDCARFNCCSPITSASAAAPRKCPVQLLLPDCVRFDCFSLIASAYSPGCSGPCPMFLNILRGVRGSVN